MHFLIKWDPAVHSVFAHWLYNSVVFSIFRKLCNHRSESNSRAFPTLREGSSCPPQVTLTVPPPPPPAPGSHSPNLCPIDFPTLGISYTWHHNMGLLWFASFTLCNVLSAHPRGTTYPYFTLCLNKSRCVARPRFIFPFINQWEIGLFSLFGWHERCCSAHTWASFFYIYTFPLSWE